MGILKGKPHIRNDDVIGRRDIRQDIDEMIGVHFTPICSRYSGKTTGYFPSTAGHCASQTAPTVGYPVPPERAAGSTLSRKVLRRSHFSNRD